MTLRSRDFKSLTATNYVTRAMEATARIALAYRGFVPISFKKLRPGRELHSRIEVLQTSALLLGYQANYLNFLVRNRGSSIRLKPDRDRPLPYYLATWPTAHQCADDVFRLRQSRSQRTAVCRAGRAYR